MAYDNNDFLYHNDFNKLVNAHKGDGVLSGCGVTTGTGLQLTVAAGYVIINGTKVTVNSATPTVSTPDASNPRKDIVTVNNSGTVSITAGTPESALPSGNTGRQTHQPDPEAIPADSVILAEIWVGAGVSAITSGDIEDARVFVVYADGVTLTVTLGEISVVDDAHNHTASTITDFDTEVSNNTDVAANTTHRNTIAGNPHALDNTDIGLGNVTNDAQLKREANDISTFAEKGAPAAADILLIEDSADAGNKKKIQITNLPAGAAPAHNDTTAKQGGVAGEYYHLTSAQHTDLTDAGDSALHYHSTDRDRANHTGTQLAITISDFDIEVSNNTDVAANTTHRSSDGKNHSDVVLNNTHRAVVSGNPHVVTKTEVSLGNVTDDAQLKRAANDFSTFVEKLSPVDADILLIEDSAAAGVKKKVQLVNLPGGATPAHNDTTGKQGGTAGEYYHLTAAQHTDLTDAGDSALHYHSTDRDRANHTGTQLAITISDFDTEVSNNTDVAANTTNRHSHTNKANLDEIDQDLATSDAVAFESMTITQTSVTGNGLYVSRNLASASTNDHVVEFRQDNTGDDQRVLHCSQYGTAETASFFNNNAGVNTNFCKLGDTAAEGSNYFKRNLSSADTAGPVISIVQDHATDDQIVVTIQQDGTNKGLYVNKLNASTQDTATFSEEVDGYSNFVSFAYGGVTHRRTAFVYRNLDSTKTGQAVMFIHQDHVGDDQYSLKIQQDGTGGGMTMSSATLSSTTYLVNLNYNSSANYFNIINNTGATYLYRNMTSVNTNSSVMSITNANSGDDQTTLTVHQYGNYHTCWFEQHHIGYAAGIFYKNLNADSASVGVLYVHQEHISGACPALAIRQDDSSEGFIDFKGSERAAITGATNSLKSVRVELNEVVYRLALFADA